MKKTMLALTGAVIILAGCQDEKPAETSAVEVPQATETEVTTSAEVTTETIDTLPVAEEQVKRLLKKELLQRHFHDFAQILIVHLRN